MMKSSPFTAVLWTALLAMGLSVPAEAQNALGDGHALDSNPQRGGRRNSGVGSTGPINYRIQNDRITGNTTGSDFFRDSVDYDSPGEFGGATGDDDLFRFRANSASSSIGALNIRSFNVTKGTYSVYRNAAPISAGQVRSLGADTSMLLRARGSGGSTFHADDLAGLINRTAARRGVGRIGSFTQPDGRLLDVTASPLSGVRFREADDAWRIRRSVSDDDANDRVMEQRPFQPTGEQPLIPSVISPYGAPSQDQSERLIGGSLLGGLGQTTPSTDHRPQRSAASVVLGAQLQAMMLSPDADPQTLQRRVKQIEQGVFDPLRRLNAKPGEDVYNDLLRNLQQRTRDKTTDSKSKPSNPWTMNLTPPSEQQLQAAEQARLDALKARGLDIRETNGDESTKQPGVESMNQFLDALGGSHSRLDSLAGNRADRTNQALREAESAMASQRYFDAERGYRQVLDLNPGYPLAQIGLVHAQLGAGLVRSAAGNLRRIFAEHPELIGVRYQANLMPSAERLEWVRQELEGMIERTNRQEPALLLAYLGYQTNQDELVRYGLALGEARQPNDPLIGVLRRLWLDDQTDPNPDAAKPSSQVEEPTPTK